MKQVCILSILAHVLALSVALADDVPKKENTPDLDALAKKIITQCARVKTGDIVQITGGIRDVDLMEALTVEAEKRGADTLLTLSPSDRTTRRLYLDVPAKFDSRTSPLQMKLTEILTVTIGIDSSEPDEVLADIPAERINARNTAQMPISEQMLKRNIRQITVGNGLYPTEARAKQLKMTKAELTKHFYAGLSVDYEKIQATGKVVRDVLASGKKAHLTTADGTNLTLTIEKRPVFVSDGVLSDDKIKKGGAACQTWLPAGEVYLTPVLGSAEGKVVVDRMLYAGKEVRGLTLTFAQGKLTKMTALSGLERIQALYDAADAGKDELSVLDIGINPAVLLPKSSPSALYQQAGMISLGLGGNVYAGGDNKSSFGLSAFLRAGTLRVDDKTLVLDGALQNPQ